MTEIAARVADRLAIADLLHTYCESLDSMDLDRLRAVFALDCEVAFGPDVRLNANGVEALVAALARLWRWRRTSHHLSNIRITFDDPDSADVVSYVIAWHERPDLSTATLYGVYRDRVVRTPDGWRIAARRQEMNGADSGFSVGIFPAARRPPPDGWVAPEIDVPPARSGA
ncbi:MAG: nuclear transport factor 2 family protein [Burkholderiales bacterium]|nr:nuclear transport factor 2 family protein [Burkholderiales bacterium]